MISKSISKEDLRHMVECGHKNERALAIAATALMNGMVTWNDAMGYSEFYRVKLHRVKTLSGQWAISSAELV